MTPLSAERDPHLGFSRSTPVFRRDEARGIIETDPRAERHSFNHQEFLAKKPANGLRLFFLGGSSLYGFPWGAAVAFPAAVERALAASYPARKVEAINAGGMSYASHRMRILAYEVLDYEPDWLVLYEGHNEFIERRLQEKLLRDPAAVGWARAALDHSRIYSGMTRLFIAAGWIVKRAEQGERAGPQGTGELLGFDVDREEGDNVGDAERAKVRGQFEANLRAIVRMVRGKGVQALLCTVASNLRDWAPNQSLVAPGVAAAGVLFDQGRALEAAGRMDEARLAYVAARDADAQPARATTEFNETIRKVARDEGALLVDIEGAFAAAAENGLVGFDLIEDYVHPKPAGHRLIAREVWRALVEHGIAGPPALADSAMFEAAAGLAVQPTSGRVTTPAALYNTGYILEHQGAIPEAIDQYEACLALSPDHFAARFNAARLWHSLRRLDRALVHFRRAVALRPEHARARAGLALALMGTGDMAAAVEEARQSVRSDPASAEGQSALAHILAAAGDLASAEVAFLRAAELAPADPIAPAGLGAVRLAAGRPAEAVDPLKRSLALKPDQPTAVLHLAAALAMTGDLEGSERLYKALIVADPTNEAARAGLERVILMGARAEAP